MSRPNPRHGTILPQDTDFEGGADQPGIAQPVSQAEIEELLYNDERPTEERLERLMEIRAEVAARESADYGGHEMKALLREVDAAIANLSDSEEVLEEMGELALLDAAYVVDPADHLDALSPDDEDGRLAIEGDEPAEEEAFAPEALAEPEPAPPAGAGDAAAE